MKRVFAALLGASFVAAVPAVAAPQPVAAAEAADPAKLSEAHAIIDVIFPADRREGMFTKLQSDLFAQLMPKRAAWMEEPGVKAIFDGFVSEAKAKQRAVYFKHLPAQMDAMASAYARAFSSAELKDISAFAHSPAGRHYLSESMALLGDPEVARANTAAVAEIRTVTEALVPAFKDKLIAYVSAHPEVAAKIKAENTAQ